MTIEGNWAEGTTKEEKLDYLHGQAWEQYEKVKFEEFLLAADLVTNINFRDKYVDFYVGDRDVYPDHFDDDHLNVISRSSVAFRQHGVQATADRKFITEVNVHLPPAPDDLRDEIEQALDLDNVDGVGVYWGTGALGGMPAPDGVVTPHIVDTEDVTFSVGRQVVNRCCDVYEEVYDDGKQALKEQP